MSSDSPLTLFEIHFTGYIKSDIIYNCGRNNRVLYRKKSDYVSREFHAWHNREKNMRALSFNLSNPHAVFVLLMSLMEIFGYKKTTEIQEKQFGFATSKLEKPYFYKFQFLILNW